MLDKKTFNIMVYIVVATAVVLMLGYATGFVPNDLREAVSGWIQTLLGFIIGLLIQKKEQG